MFCTKCGEKLDNYMVYCPFCSEPNANKSPIQYATIQESESIKYIKINVYSLICCLILSLSPFLNIFKINLSYFGEGNFSYWGILKQIKFIMDNLDSYVALLEALVDRLGAKGVLLILFFLLTFVFALCGIIFTLIAIKEFIESTSYSISYITKYTFRANLFFILYNVILVLGFLFLKYVIKDAIEINLLGFTGIGYFSFAVLAAHQFFVIPRRKK